MVRCTIEHLHEEGTLLLRSTVIRIKDAYYDEGYIVRGIITPSIVLVGKTSNFAIQPANPQQVLATIKINLEKRQDFTLFYNVFDVSLLKNKEAFEVLKNTNGLTALPTELKHVNVHMLARTQPTPNKPQNISKFQYFKFLLS